MSRENEKQKSGNAFINALKKSNMTAMAAILVVMIIICLLYTSQLVMEDVTFLLARPEPFLFPVRSSEWMNIMHFIHLHMQMVIII